MNKSPLSNTASVAALAILLVGIFLAAKAVFDP